MKIYNETKTEILENPDLTKGYLTTDTLTKHIDYVAPVAEVGHYVTIREYPETGGKDVEWVVDVPEVKEVLEHDETEEIQVYHLYTTNELRKMELENEKSELDQWLHDHDYIGVKIATGRATVEEYATEIALMTEKANRINAIEEELKTLELD